MSTMIPTYENFNNRVTYIWNLFNWHESFYSTPSYELTQVESPRWLILLQSNGFWVFTWKKATNPGQPPRRVTVVETCWPGLEGRNLINSFLVNWVPRTQLSMFSLFSFLCFFFLFITIPSFQEKIIGPLFSFSHSRYLFNFLVTFTTGRKADPRQTRG